MDSLLRYLTANYEGKAVEVGVGDRSETAGELSRRGFTVVCTDVRERETPDEVEFVVDDVQDPGLSVYRGADVVYSVRPPYELHRHLREVADEVDADLVMKPLGNEPTPLTHDLVNVDGEALYVVRNR